MRSDSRLTLLQQRVLEQMPETVQATLAAAGIVGTTIQASPRFCRLHVSDGEEIVVIDLVADPCPGVEPPSTEAVAGVPCLVDSAREILVNKSCALMSRSELRDLEDVEALLASGLDLGDALAAAPKKDAGFSPLTLAWALRELHPRTLAAAARYSDRRAAALDAFRLRFIDRLLDAARPTT